jgi:hypothetical protein
MVESLIKDHYNSTVQELHQFNQKILEPGVGIQGKYDHYQLIDGACALMVRALRLRTLRVIEV